MHPHMRVVVALALAGAVNATCIAHDDELQSEPAREVSSMHALIGGQADMPGGTFALGQQTNAMSLEFERENIVDNVGIAIRYLNEGFLGPQNEPAPLPLWTPLHYKDAFGLLATYWKPVGRACRLGAALGPEIYFDTTATTFRSLYENRHGVGIQANISGQCRLMQGLAVEATATRSVDFISFPSSTLMVGLVFTPRDLNRAGGEEPRPDAELIGRLEVTAGRVDLDSFDVRHDDGTTTWITYGRMVGGSLGWDASLLREKVAAVVDRRGGALELTAQHSFWLPWVQVFAGMGPYLARSIDYEKYTCNTQLNLVLTYGFRVALGRRFYAVAKLARVAANAARNDADHVTFGFAVRTP